MENTKKVKSIYQKLLKVQEELKPIEKDAFNPFFKSNYFDVNSILRVLMPILTKHGLVLTQPFEADGENGVFNSMITTYVTDSESGEQIASSIYLPNNLDPQKMGSAITYFRRYSLQALFALQAVDDDAEGVLRPKYDYTDKSKLSPDQYGAPKKDPLKKEPKHKDVGKDAAEHDTAFEV